MSDRADSRNADVTLALHCPACHGQISVTYQPFVLRMDSIENAYRCPHCHATQQIALPGTLLPPVQRRERA